MRPSKRVEKRCEAVVFLKMAKTCRSRVGRPALGEARDGRTKTVTLGDSTRLEEWRKKRGPMIVDRDGRGASGGRRAGSGGFGVGVGVGVLLSAGIVVVGARRRR